MDSTPGLSPNSVTRDITLSLKRTPVADVSELGIKIASDLVAGRTVSAETRINSLIASVVCDAARRDLSAGAIRSWWEEAGLDRERAEALATAATAVMPELASKLKAQGG